MPRFAGIPTHLPGTTLDYAEQTADQPVTTTLADVAGMTLIVPPSGPISLQVDAEVIAVTDQASISVFIVETTSGSDVIRAQAGADVSGANGTACLSRNRELPASAVQRTFKLQSQTEVGAGTLFTLFTLQPITFKAVAA